MPIFVFYHQISVKIAIKNYRQTDPFSAPFFAPYTRARVIESCAHASRLIE
jgi:hypothetical protein